MFMLSAILPAATAAIAAAGRTTVVMSRKIGNVLRAWRHRREIMKLAGLDDHQLKDIGLSRTDVGGALAVSFLHDPSHVLCDIAGSGHGRLAWAINRDVPVAEIDSTEVSSPALCR
jgi:uncharacterized protein YjiS (DUF1127 family)